MSYSLEEILDLKGEAEITLLIEVSEIQSSYNLKARRRGLKMADFLVDEKGKIDSNRLKLLLELFERKGYILYPLGIDDSDLTLYVCHALKALIENRSILHALERIALPLCNLQAYEYAMDSVGVDKLTDVHLRRALLSALLTPLRQSVGSCFATAPAILIQEEQVAQLAEDLVEILTTGQLKRTFGGRDYCVPMSPSAGIGDLKRKIDSQKILYSPAVRRIFGEEEIPPGKTVEAVLEAQFEGERLRRAKARFVAYVDHPLLKMWEFTLASFSESKMEFSRWHLYSSLGMHPEEKGGIGKVIYHHLEQRLQEENALVLRYQNEATIAQEQVRATERLLSQAGSESEARRLNAEHQGRLYQFRVSVDTRDKHQHNAEKLSEFFPYILREYGEEFPGHFQEIYDAEMADLSGENYSDSPAGFRLIYKHGRSQASSWSFIRNSQEYLWALRDFFMSSESQIAARLNWELGSKVLDEITTAIVHHLQTEEFLQSAFERMAKARGISAPFKTILEYPIKPWAYISGGTMAHLIKTYFRLEGSISEESHLVENPIELCIFLIDLLKSREYHSRLLMSSPTHAFSLLPKMPLLHQASNERLFTYTWVRDHLIFPQRAFYEGILLSSAEQAFLAEKVGLGPGSSSGYLTPKEWGSQFSSPIDGFLFSSLPLIPPEEWEERAYKLLQIIGFVQAKNYLPKMTTYLTRQEAHAHLIAACIRAKGILSARDLHLSLASAMRKERLAPPEPLIFADSNWTKYSFAFLVNPVTGELELWRVDKIGLRGEPMREWKAYLGSGSKAQWTVLVNPIEYRVAKIVPLR